MISTKDLDLHRQLIDIDRADCEESLYVYLKSAWHVFDSAPWVDGWAIDVIAEHLQAVVDGEIRRLIINVPPRMSKSATVSVALTGWTWAQRKHSHTSGPGVSFLYASFREDLSRRDSVACRRIIESKWYKDRWGDRFTLSDDQNTKSRFSNDKGGYRLITSIESKGATGDGANIICLDDCNSAKEVESELVIASTLEWFDGTLGTRLNNQKLGAVINVQQRLGENDITGHILSKNTGEWCHLMLPMEYEPERSYVNAYGWKDPRTQPGELLWPERFGPEEVTALKNWMGTWRSNGQLQQRPSPKGGGIIKREWWQPWERVEFPPMDFILGTLDTAYTLEQMNDPSGMIIWGVFSGDLVGRSVRSFDHNGRLAYSERTYTEPEAPKVMALHAWTDRLEFYELINRTAETCIRLKVDLLLVENKAAGISVAQELRRLYGHQSFSVQLFDPKSQDKFARLVSVQHLFQEKLIYVPTADYLWIDEMITQIEGFPRAKHDEYVDLTSMGLRYLRDRGLISRAVERRAEMDSLKIYPRGQDIPLYPA